MTEHLSRIGVPTFMADVKGDPSGMAAAGSLSPKMTERLKVLGVDAPTWQACPVVFWDGFGASSHPVRAPVSGMGPCCSAGCSA